MALVNRAVAAGVAVGMLALAACAQAPPELDTRAAAPAGGPPAPQATSAEQPDTLLLLDDRIRESSGLAASAAHPTVLYTHNDRGHGAEIFAVGPDGTTSARLTLEGVRAVDWEDVAVTPDERIWIGDIGDNDRDRHWISVYVTEEPQDLVDGSLDWTRYRFRYEDGPRNAEALMVHPESQRIYVVSKESRSGGIYAAPRSLDADEVHVLTRIADSPPGVTAGDFAPDGERLALRTGRNGYAYTDIGGKPWALVLPPSVKGESLTFAPDGAAILVGSEGEDSPVSRVRLPRVLTAATTSQGAAQ